MSALDDAVKQSGANNVYNGPLFSEVLPYEKAWGALKPTIEAEGATQVNPFVQRDLNKNLYSYYTGLAGQGGQRFGYKGAGSMEAAAEATRKAQILDWVNQREQGYKTLFYDPAQKAFNQAIEYGQSPTAPKIPTWEEMAKLYGSTYNQNSAPVAGLQRQFGPELKPIVDQPIPTQPNQSTYDRGYSMPWNGGQPGMPVMPIGGRFGTQPIMDALRNQSTYNKGYSTPWSGKIGSPLFPNQSLLNGTA
jgi:hypothetical protein